MKARILTTITLMTLTMTSVSAYASCKMDKMKSCHDIEKTRSNYTRGGLSATEFCAAEAVIECNGRYTTPTPSANNYGYDAKTVRELKEFGISPAEARAIEQACGAACR